VVNFGSSVTISGEDTGEVIQYTVTDNGIAIKSADHERIFELFTRSDEVKEYEGAGWDFP
jgi:light-regulated signal transduction histidine kinase (bacteriophytochrome)